jgi:hypothetical protein
MEINVDMLQTLPEDADTGLSVEADCGWTCSWTCSWTGITIN